MLCKIGAAAHTPHIQYSDIVYIQNFCLGGVIIAIHIVATSCESLSGKLRQMEATTSFQETMHLYSSFAFAAVPGKEE
jgi:hypothetical protein